VEFEHPLILVVNNKISRVQEILPILELAKDKNKPIVVFSQDLQDEPVSMMVYNNKSGNIKCAAVNVPWSGGFEQDNLKDIAVMTGATVVDNDMVLELKDVEFEHLGRA
jgi:chaperonin GroEL